MDILSETKEIIAAVLRIPVEKLDEKAEMSDVEGWDSIRNVMILAQLEEHFDVVFSAEDIFDMTSVKAIAEDIVKLINE